MAPTPGLKSAMKPTGSYQSPERDFVTVFPVLSPNSPVWSPEKIVPVPRHRRDAFVSHQYPEGQYNIVWNEDCDDGARSDNILGVDFDTVIQAIEDASSESIKNGSIATTCLYIVNKRNKKMVRVKLFHGDPTKMSWRATIKLGTDLPVPYKIEDAFWFRNNWPQETPNIFARLKQKLDGGTFFERFFAPKEDLEDDPARGIFGVQW